MINFANAQWLSMCRLTIINGLLTLKTNDMNLQVITTTIAIIVAAMSFWASYKYMKFIATKRIYDCYPDFKWISYPWTVSYIPLIIGSFVFSSFQLVSSYPWYNSLYSSGILVGVFTIIMMIIKAYRPCAVIKVDETYYLSTSILSYNFEAVNLNSIKIKDPILFGYGFNKKIYLRNKLIGSIYSCSKESEEFINSCSLSNKVQ